jgi:hypothetical protein
MMKRYPDGRVLSQVVPQGHAVGAGKRGLAGHNALAQPAPDRPHIRVADEKRPISDRARPFAAERLPEGGERETRVLLLADDALGPEHAQQSVMLQILNAFLRVQALHPGEPVSLAIAIPFRLPGEVTSIRVSVASVPAYARIGSCGLDPAGSQIGCPHAFEVCQRPYACCRRRLVLRPRASSRPRRTRPNRAE